MKKIGLLLILIVLGSLTGIVSTAQGIQYTPLLQLESEEVYLTAGQENTIELELENKGDFMIFEVQAVLSSLTPGITVVSGSHKIWNEIEEEDSVSWEPVVYVNPEVPLGSYGLTLTLSYVQMFSTGAILPEIASLQVGVVVTRVAAPKLQILPPEEDIYLTAGDYREVVFELKNIWDEEIRDLEISLEPSTPYISVVEGITFSLDELEVGESFTLSPLLYVSENALPSDSMLTLKTYFQDKPGNAYSQYFNIPMTLESVGSPRITTIVVDRIQTVPSIIKPGDQFTLRLEVKAGGAVAYDVTSSLVFMPPNPLSPLSPTVVMVGDLEPGEKAAAEYELLVDGAIPAGQYPLTATISFINSKGAPAMLSETITVLIESIVDFELLQTEEIELTKGEASEIELDLLLIGTQSVRFVDVELIPDQVFESAVGDKVYIGVVDPDSPIPFDINVYVGPDAEEESHVMRLKITYTDHLNREHEEVIELTAEVVEPQVEVRSAQGIGGFWLWLRRLFGIAP